MRKVDIRARVQELNLRLRARRDTEAKQSDERVRLMNECQAAGDHVHELVWLGEDLGIAKVCEFCGHLQGATAQQIARNLQRG